MAPRVLVLGAGISGLAAAYEICEKARRERRPVAVTVLEASSRIGGKIVTESRDGLVIEGGPDSFITLKPDALELIRELGLAGEVVQANTSKRTLWIYLNRKLEPVPAGTGLLPTRVWPFLTASLFSCRAKIRMAREPWIPPLEGEEDETLAAFTRRRLGSEALERLVGPMLSGIYAGDPEKMSLKSTFPQLKELERRGGLMRALWRGGGALGESPFATLKGGLSRLTEALALKLPGGSVRTGIEVLSLAREGGRWKARTTCGVVEADAVISALPAPRLAQAIEDEDLELACVLREIPFVSTASVSLAYDAGSLPPLGGWGFLVPRAEGRALSGVTYTSVKFPHRAPPELALVRCFVGGAGREEAAEGDDQTVARVARNELKDILNLGDLHPKVTRVFRWPKANPQYTVGHGLRLKRLESCLRDHPGLFLAGCSYDGVGIPDCIRSGRAAAAKALKALAADLARRAHA